jgi:hypothetical protein
VDSASRCTASMYLHRTSTTYMVPCAVVGASGCGSSSGGTRRGGKGVDAKPDQLLPRKRPRAIQPDSGYNAGSLRNGVGKWWTAAFCPSFVAVESTHGTGVWRPSFPRSGELGQ